MCGRHKSCKYFSISYIVVGVILKQVILALACVIRKVLQPKLEIGFICRNNSLLTQLVVAFKDKL